MKKSVSLREVGDTAELLRRSKAQQELNTFLYQVGLVPSFSAPRQKVFERIALAAEHEGNLVCAAMACQYSAMDYGAAYLVKRAETMIRRIDDLRRSCHPNQRPRISEIHAATHLDLALRTGRLGPGITEAEAWLSSPMASQVPANCRHRHRIALSRAYFYAGHSERSVALEAEVRELEAELDLRSRVALAGLHFELGTMALIQSHPYFADALFPLDPASACVRHAPEYLTRAVEAISGWPVDDPAHPNTLLRKGYLEDIAILRAALSEPGSLLPSVPDPGDPMRLSRLYLRSCALLLNDQPQAALSMMRLIEWNPLEQRGLFHIALLFLLSRIYKRLGDESMALGAYEAYVNAFSATLLNFCLLGRRATGGPVSQMGELGEEEGRPQFLVDAIHLIRQAQGLNFTVAGLAHDLGISERTLRSAFERFAGVSPRKYFETVRLESLHAQLTAGCWSRGSLVDLAARYGFTSYSRFLKAYVERFGQRPREVLRGT